MNKTEKRISYKAGITRTPSDYLCQDGELAECINLTTDHEELKVMVEPEVMFGGSAKSEMLYVHEGSTYKNYICVATHGVNQNSVLGWFDDAGHAGYVSTSYLLPQTRPVITHVGNILIVADSSTMLYFKWNPSGTSYSDLGSKIPELEVTFAMKDGYRALVNLDMGVDYLRDGRPLIIRRRDTSSIVTWNGSALVMGEGKQEEYNDLVRGMYAEAELKVTRARQFSRPFMVVYALELYDGSFTMISNPVLMLPSVSNNYAAVVQANICYMSVNHAHLYAKCDTDYTDWRDLVKGVAIFASRQIPLLSAYGDCGLRGSNINAGITGDISSYHSDIVMMNSYGRNQYQVDDVNTPDMEIPKRTKTDIIDDIGTESIFYRIATIPLAGYDGKVTPLIKEGTLENLTTQDQLTSGDYFSRCQLVPQNLMTYNSRAMLANVSRGFFNGFAQFMPYDNSTMNSINVFVYIKTADGIRVVTKSYSTYEKVGLYFYYPDPRAYRAVVFIGNDLYKDMELKEHPFLNGAYYFAELPINVGEQTGNQSGVTLTECQAAVSTTPEQLSNQLFTSEVNNPFVFTSKGNKTIGAGRIIALATLTTELSQGKFGQNPVIIFTTDGIWAMQVDKEGYLEPAQPMSREVCVNAKSVLETDGAVFFASKKGLMRIVGNQVKCVSIQMNGATCNVGSVFDAAPGTDTNWAGIISSCSNGDSFLQYIRSASCFLAYDYIDSRILIINPSYSFSYVYGMADGTVSKVVFSSTVERVIHSYPDHLLQDSAGKVYSLYGKKDESEVSGRQYAFLLTRPMKLSGPVNVSSLRELVNVGCWNKSAGSLVKTEVWLSDNLQTWFRVNSRFGAAAKFFRIGLYVYFKATERLSGTVLRVQERRTDNVRV